MDIGLEAYKIQYFGHINCDEVVGPHFLYFPPVSGGIVKLEIVHYFQ